MNLHDRQFIFNLLKMAVARFNTSIDRETLLCPRNNDVPKSGNWPAASERAIAHRLAYYLEDILVHEFRLSENSQISVDCEYNRHGKAGKTHTISKDLVKIVRAANRKAVEIEKQQENRAEDELASPEFVFSVAPDIVVHRRQVDEDNLLVVELKKQTNKENREYDDLKLKQFTDPDDYHYRLGAAVIAVDDVPSEGRCLQIASIYEDGLKVWPRDD